MEKTVFDLFRLLFPLSGVKRRHVQVLATYLDDDQLSYIKQLLKLGKVGVSYQKERLNPAFCDPKPFPQLNKAKPDKELNLPLANWNNKIKKLAEEELFQAFAPNAKAILPGLIAPHIVGLDAAKKVAAYQLFSPERFHVLLLGDPGTGKTEILRGASQYAPISSFGLGSGTSAAGLAAAKKGKEIVKGLLPLAHKGVCCIDELNLLKPADRGALLNAMEKGFVTYDKGGRHQEFPAEVRVLATANPKGDRFVGSKVHFLKEQLPFDPALLSRFHFVFFVRRPSKEEFLKITKRLVSQEQDKVTKEDVDFIRSYVAYASKQKVAFNKELEPIITDFFDDIKSREDDYLIELSPRLVLGVVRLAKAIARVQLREMVMQDDLQEAIRIFKESLIIAPDSVAEHRRSRS